MEEEFKIVKAYKENKTLRNSFNELAKKTFDLDFEDWYQNGYWKEQYNPYSIVFNNRVIANVSVNDMEFEIDEKRKRYIQLGTVMTEPKYRNRGLIRKLMQEIEQDFKEKIDGYFLFANDSVLEFYPKFGFQKCNEYRYSKAVCIEKEKTALQIVVTPCGGDSRHSARRGSTDAPAGRRPATPIPNRTTPRQPDSCGLRGHRAIRSRGRWPHAVRATAPAAAAARAVRKRTHGSRPVRHCCRAGRRPRGGCLRAAVRPAANRAVVR